jgi:hypothetical protein
LRKQALFFCRADKFPDPFEGSLPRREADYRVEDRRKNKMPETIINDNIDALSSVHRMFKKKHLINCWHIDNHENDSMWRLYLKDNDGVAIRTTVSKLLNSFNLTEKDVFCSKVRYLDYNTDVLYDKSDYRHYAYSLFTPLVHKRIEFKNESELRLIHSLDQDGEKELEDFWLTQEFDKGINIEIDVENLIDTVFCCPTSNEKHKNKITSLCNNYGFNFRVEVSSLSVEPIF